MPLGVREAIAEAEVAMRSDPTYALKPIRRIAIYNAFGRRHDPVALRVLSHLAIITARHVLPLFQQAAPQDEMPTKLLDLADAVAQKKLSATSPEVTLYMDQSYHRMGSSWLAEMPWPSHLAAYATRKALLEACGFDPLGDLDECSMFTATGEAIPGSQWTDEDLCLDEAGDTASAAAVASATTATTSFATDPIPVCEPERLLRFWEWWLTKRFLWHGP